MSYIPRNNWVVCERTGIKFRRSEMRQEWNGLWVHNSVWNPRHPQDYVKVEPENTTASLVLPQIEQSVYETTLPNNLWLTNTNYTIIVTTTEVSEGDAVGVVLNNGTAFWTYAYSVESITNGPLIDSNYSLVIDANGDVVYTADSYSGYEVTLATEIWSDADYGNVLLLPAINNETWN